MAAGTPASTPTFGLPRPCLVANCPLNEKGIPHSQGVYKHNGKRHDKFSVVFASSNRPDFVWEAKEKVRATWKAIAEAEKKGQEVTELRKIEEEYGGIVCRFLDNHAGCSCSHGGGGCSHPY